MDTPTHEFVTVEMRGLKAALMARAQTERVSVSVLVRAAVEHELGLVKPSAEPEGAMRPSVPAGPIVKLSIRLTSDEAEQLDAGARRAGLSRGAFLAGLLANIPSLTGDSASLLDCLAALTASSAELSNLSRNINHLTALLRQGEVGPAQQYRRMLDTLGDDVRAHLSLAARVLAEQRPARRSAKHDESKRPAAS